MKRRTPGMVLAVLDAQAAAAPPNGGCLAVVCPCIPNDLELAGRKPSSMAPLSGTRLVKRIATPASHEAKPDNSRGR